MLQKGGVFAGHYGTDFMAGMTSYIIMSNTDVTRAE